MWVACLIPDAKLHEPLRLKPPACRTGGARPGALTGNHRQPFVAEQFATASSPR
jgi:hypothetical protein